MQHGESYIAIVQAADTENFALPVQIFDSGLGSIRLITDKRSRREGCLRAVDEPCRTQLDLPEMCINEPGGTLEIQALPPNPCQHDADQGGQVVGRAETFEGPF